MKATRKTVLLALAFAFMVPVANAADEELLTAMLQNFLANADKAAAHENFWADDLVYSSSSGLRFGKADIMQGFEGADEEPAGPPPIVYSGEDVDVRLYGDTAAQAVENQGLMGLGNTDLPGRTRVLGRGQRRGTGTAVITGDGHVIGMRLGDTRSHGPDTDLGYQLDRDSGLLIHILEVVDQLGQVLDVIDIVMRRRRYQRHSWRRMAHPSDEFRDLEARQLAALARFSALGDFNLNFTTLIKVLCRHAEATRGDLFDCRIGVVAIG